MNKIPMLPICGFRFEPPSTMRPARRALHALNEALAHLPLQITTATICHNPRFRGAFNVTLVHSSHTFHRKSVDVEEQLVFLHLHVPNFSVEPLALCGWLAVPACLHTSPKNRLSDFWRRFGAEVRELPEATLHPLFDIPGRCSNWRRNLLILVRILEKQPRITASRVNGSR